MVNALAAKFLTDGKNDIYRTTIPLYWALSGEADSGLASCLIAFNGEITILLSDIDQDNSDNRAESSANPGQANNFLPAYRSRIPTDASCSSSTLSCTPTRTPMALPPWWDRLGTDELLGRRGVFNPRPRIPAHDPVLPKGHRAPRRRESADTWINEMCSQLVEDLVADKLGVKGPRGVSSAMGDAGPTGNIFGRIPTSTGTCHING